jgi:hypothetical protein
MVRPNNGASEVAPSCSFSACQGVHVGGCQSLAADPPVTAFHLLNEAQRVAAHGLTFNRDQRVADVCDFLCSTRTPPGFNDRHVFDSVLAARWNDAREN